MAGTGVCQEGLNMNLMISFSGRKVHRILFHGLKVLHIKIVFWGLKDIDMI